MKFFKDVQKDLENLKSRKSNFDNNLFIPFMYVGKNDVVGQILIPLTDNNEEQDVYTIKKIHKFGKSIIPSTPKNDEVLKNINGLNEFIQMLKKRDDIDFRLKYSKVDSLSIGMFNPKMKNPVFVLNLQYTNTITSFLEQLVKHYNQYGDDIFKCIFVIKRNNSDIVVDVKKLTEKTSSELLESLFPNEHIEYRKLLYHKLYDDFNKNEDSIKGIVFKWMSEVKKYLGQEIQNKPEPVINNFTSNDSEELPDWLNMNTEEGSDDELLSDVDFTDDNLPDFLKE